MPMCTRSGSGWPVAARANARPRRPTIVARCPVTRGAVGQPPRCLPGPHVGAPVDANGNLTGDGPRTFEWDARNQLGIIVGTHRAEYVDHGLRRRVRYIEKGNGVTTADTRVPWCEPALCASGRRRRDRHAAGLRAGRTGQRRRAPFHDGPSRLTARGDGRGQAWPKAQGDGVIGRQGGIDTCP
jgi:hypothetical protein